MGSVRYGRGQGGHLFAAMAFFQAFQARKRVPVGIIFFLYRLMSRTA